MGKEKLRHGFCKQASSGKKDKVMIHGHYKQASWEKKYKVKHIDNVNKLEKGKGEVRHMDNVSKLEKVRHG